MYKNRISVLSRKGDEISKISPPFGYIFYRFIDGEKLSVICQGNNNTADKYGRNDWKFKYDFLNNTWHKNLLLIDFSIQCLLTISEICIC